jgi:hypothetical protein
LLILVAAALAAPLELVPRGGSAKTMSTTVSTAGADISTASFVAAILDCDRYPLGAGVMGVKALKFCHTLEKRSDGYTVIHQLTGGNSLVSSREYVIALKVTANTDTRARIEWDLVKHDGKPGSMTGPYASALNAYPDAVYTPYNTGGWEYDKTAGTIKYWAQSDPGGSVPGFLVSQDAVMAFPLELLRVKWGVGK